MDYLGKIISIDRDNAVVLDDAYSIDIDADGNYLLNVYIANPFNVSKEDINLNSLMKKSRKVNDSYRAIYIKNKLLALSLTDEEEKDVFAFKFKISPEGDILSYEVTAELQKIDIKCTQEYVCDEIQNDTEFADYMLTSYNLGEILYCKRTNAETFETYGYEREFDFPFPIEFIYLVNRTLTSEMIGKDISMIYYVQAPNDYIRCTVEPIYYTTEPTKNKHGEYYAQFNSPLRSYESLMNLYAYNEFILRASKSEDKYKSYQRRIANYVRIDKRYDED